MKNKQKQLTDEEIKVKVHTLVEKFAERLPYGYTAKLFKDNYTEQDRMCYALCVFVNGVQMIDKFNVRVTHGNHVWYN